MVDGITENIFLVNAPAGSGKTTNIKNMIITHTINQPNDNILCITYTNRAADELKKGIESQYVHISTIHSFLNKFVSIYFSKREIIDLYFEFYKDNIMKRINNINSDVSISESNERYIQKYGKLDFETVKSNIKSIAYNESNFSAFLYGMLSHDDLIIFTEEIFKKIPKVKKRLSQKYQLIFIDEYQDSSASVLRIFCESIVNTETKLYFLGDKMQQIYKNYDGSFESEASTLNTSISLDTNHRSVTEIITILNNLYNDDSFKQNPSSENIDKKPEHLPRVLICNNIEKKLDEEREKYPDALLLYLFKRKKFETIGAGNLYSKVDKMDKYQFPSQISASDVLTDNSSENQDPLFKLMFLINRISTFYESNNLGGCMKLFKLNSKIFNKSVFTLTSHADKTRITKLLESIIIIYYDLENKSCINDVLEILKTTSIVKSDYIDFIREDSEYTFVLEIKVSEFRAITLFLEKQNISTQHGVKGESHNTVFFIAEDSKQTPIVYMYDFFKLWSNIEISLIDLERFYYEYKKSIDEVVQHIGFKLREINKPILDVNFDYLLEKSKQLLELFGENNIFMLLFSEPYQNFISKPNVKNAKECFKETIPYGVLSAYRLFYVGCSRARKNLSIFIDQSKLNEFEEKFIKKLESIGFIVERY